MDFVISHTVELARRADYAPAVSDFLSPGEQAVVWRESRDKHRLFFWGGFSGAERRTAVFLPDWAADNAPSGDFLSEERELYLKDLLFGENAPFADEAASVSLLSASWRGGGELSHRDFLGSLMGLGIERSIIGDICVMNGEAVLAVRDRLSLFIIDNLKKIGRESVSLSPTAQPESFVYKRQFEEVSCTVSSMRLDCIVSALTGFSRNKSAEYVEGGLVFLRGEERKDVTATVRVGDTVAVRGKGKFKITDNSTLTAKSRIKLHAEKYV